MTNTQKRNDLTDRSKALTLERQRLLEAAAERITSRSNYEIKTINAELASIRCELRRMNGP